MVIDVKYKFQILARFRKHKQVPDHVTLTLGKSNFHSLHGGMASS